MLIGGSSRCVPSIRAPPPPARGHSLPCRPGLLRDSDSIDASHGLARGAHHPAQAERPAQPDAAHQGQDRLTRAIAPPPNTTGPVHPAESAGRGPVHRRDMRPPTARPRPRPRAPLRTPLRGPWPRRPRLIPARQPPRHHCQTEETPQDQPRKQHHS